MCKYFIESFKISKLWGYLDIDLDFNSDVNILIGPNGSGKTTVLNLLNSILTADLRSALKVGFEHAEIGLRNFHGQSVGTVEVNAADRFLKICADKKKFQIDFDDLSKRKSGSHLTLFFVHERGDTAGRAQSKDSRDVLITLVPIAWLPVSRGFPISEDGEELFTRAEAVESVNSRLRELLDEISDYHSRLNALLSEHYTEFEHQVLSAILYSKEEDQLDSVLDSIRNSTVHPLPTKVEKEQLRSAFEAAGLLDERMEEKIKNHFAAVEEVLNKFNENSETDLEDILVLPLISRTKSMVEFARKLEEERKATFAPLRRYEDIVNLFLNEKSVQIDESGRLVIASSSNPDLDPLLLSSGEKQILILLTQALVRSDEPVVYMADEPELSLHVTWQEKLLESLVTLGGQIQVIVATHSPDIVGRFRDKVIQLGRKN